MKETFNGFGNAIEYLGRYTNKIAISNSRILSVTASQTTFSARGKIPGKPKREITITNEEFIRRQKIRNSSDRTVGIIFLHNLYFKRILNMLC